MTHFPDQMIIDITQADIDDGARCNSSTCPMSNAVDRVLPKGVFACTSPYAIECLPDGTHKYEWQVEILREDDDSGDVVASYNVDSDTGKVIASYDDEGKHMFTPRKAILTKVKA